MKKRLFLIFGLFMLLSPFTLNAQNSLDYYNSLGSNMNYNDPNTYDRKGENHNGTAIPKWIKKKVIQNDCNPGHDYQQINYDSQGRKIKFIDSRCAALKDEYTYSNYQQINGKWLALSINHFEKNDVNNWYYSIKYYSNKKIQNDNYVFTDESNSNAIERSYYESGKLKIRKDYKPTNLPANSVQTYLNKTNKGSDLALYKYYYENGKWKFKKEWQKNKKNKFVYKSRTYYNDKGKTTSQSLYKINKKTNKAYVYKYHKNSATGKRKYTKQYALNALSKTWAPYLQKYYVFQSKNNKYKTMKHYAHTKKGKKYLYKYYKYNTKGYKTKCTKYKVSKKGTHYRNKIYYYKNGKHNYTKLIKK